MFLKCLPLCVWNNSFCSWIWILLWSWENSRKVLWCKSRSRDVVGKQAWTYLTHLFLGGDRNETCHWPLILFPWPLNIFYKFCFLVVLKHDQPATDKDVSSISERTQDSGQYSQLCSDYLLICPNPTITTLKLFWYIINITFKHVWRYTVAHFKRRERLLPDPKFEDAWHLFESGAENFSR